tara:strand:+ start:2816 stop:2977 length:162 start_codon:yes stop_codon:yes gene_type:complete
MPGTKQAKKLTSKQMKIASAAAPTNKITAADFAELRKKQPKKKSMMSSFGERK